jgi:threonine dehydrogenase-like Zn-dependent dehydrogenase
MRAVVVSEPGVAAAVEVLPDPAPSPDGVVVDVRGCGICGTEAGGMAEFLAAAA